MALLPKGGLSIGGHKVPWEAIAAIAGVAGVILVIRARQQGQNVASVGQAPYTAASSGFGASGFSPDYSGALANISSQLTSLSQSIAGPPSTPATSATPSPVPAPQTKSQIAQAYTAINPNPTGGIPVYSYNQQAQGVIGYLQPGQALNVIRQATGFAGDQGYLISLPGGGEGYVLGTEVGISQQVPISQ